MLENIKLKVNKNIIIIIVAIGATLFFSKNIFDRHNSKINMIKNKIKTYEREIDLAKEINILSKETEKFKGLGWSTRESVAIMGKINDLATKYEVEISSFDPGGRKESISYLIFSMNLTINAEYFSLIRFLSAIEALSSLTKITTLKINPASGSILEEKGPLAKAYVSIDAYILKE